MEAQTHRNGRTTDAPIFAALEKSRRRSILELLIDEDTPHFERDLATAVTAMERDIPVADVPSEATRSVHLDLHHDHLPILEDCGFVTIEPDKRRITPTDHIAFTDPRFRQVLSLEGEQVDSVIAGLANKRRRLLLAILRDRQEPISHTALARKITQRERGESERAKAVVDDITLALKHTHLPLLGNADIIEYNREADRVAYTESPTLEHIVTIFHEPKHDVLRKVDRFFGGLVTSYRHATKSPSEPFSWPASWREPYHG
ncbi:hypothetical protein [Haladaptatus sp. CMAA 1911]|uniref:DUF7344 domain-containing protein n=1 Tax=unclassified Haladaptatus TaxID=2622732 RepID=UPI003754288A